MPTRRALLLAALMLTLAMDALIIWAFWMVLTTGRF